MYAGPSPPLRVASPLLGSPRFGQASLWPTLISILTLANPHFGNHASLHCTSLVVPLKGLQPEG